VSKPGYSTNIYTLADTVLESKRSEILRWISVIPYTEHHTRITAARLAGTGEWLFQKREYKEWLSSSVSKLLLLRGIRKFRLPQVIEMRRLASD
jgi:hypothetical protein